jgi:hypothetical protein
VCVSGQAAFAPTQSLADREPLGLIRPVDWSAGARINRVDRLDRSIDRSIERADV